MTVEDSQAPSRRSRLLVVFMIAGIVAGSVLAVGFQIGLSALPDVAWAGPGLWKTITPQFLPDFGFWAVIALAGGLPAAFISFLFVGKKRLRSGGSIAAVLAGPWVLALPAVIVFHLGDGFLFADGPTWQAAIEFAAVSAALGSIAFIAGLLVAVRRNLVR